MEINTKAHAAILKALRGTPLGFDTDKLCLTDGTTPMNLKIGRLIEQQDGRYGFQYSQAYLNVDTEVSIKYIRPCLEALNKQGLFDTLQQAAIQPEAIEETA